MERIPGFAEVIEFFRLVFTNLVLKILYMCNVNVSILWMVAMEEVSFSGLALYGIVCGLIVASVEFVNRRKARRVATATVDSM